MPSQKTISIICVLAWVSVQAILLLSNGIVTSNEAEKYIGQALHLIRDHKLDDNKYIFYFVPILSIYASLQLHAGFLFAIGLQLIINALATIVFYKIAKNLFGYSIRAVLAVLLYISFIPIQEWNTYLYTESLFYSFCVFFMYACMVMDNGKASTHLARFTALLLLLFTRPLGILFIPALLFIYIAQSKIQKGLKWAIALGIHVALYFVINFLYRSNADMDILMPQVQGMVICYGGENIQGTNITIPSTQNPALNICLFVIDNPIYFIKLASLRLLSFFTLYRREYSALHNLYLAFNMLVLYALTLVAFVRGHIIKLKSVKYTFFTLLIILCIGVTLQCNDYNSRFSMPLFPWLFLFAIDGSAAINNRQKA